MAKHTLSQCLTQGLLDNGWKPCDARTARVTLTKRVKVKNRRTGEVIGETDAFVFVLENGNARITDGKAKFTNSRAANEDWVQRMIDQGRATLQAKATPGLAAARDALAALTAAAKKEV